MFETRTNEELVRLASAGAGFEIDVSVRPEMDLLRLANAARAGGAKLRLEGLGAGAEMELLRIANAGGGNIVFAD